MNFREQIRGAFLQLSAELDLLPVMDEMEASFKANPKRYEGPALSKKELIEIMELAVRYYLSGENKKGLAA